MIVPTSGIAIASGGSHAGVIQTFCRSEAGSNPIVPRARPDS